jgi:hypothetical protein
MLLDQVRQKARLLHRSIRTERAYVYWIVRFLRFHRQDGEWRHPSTMGAAEVEAFLTALAVQEGVSASTQNQALASLLFLFQVVLEKERVESMRCGRGGRSACRLCCRRPRWPNSWPPSMGFQPRSPTA